ncbi:hypothetical protein J6590_088881 [Homalodisca vitripennis]|nr:hypothetical protein J6590_088881 [Homalodisca vitripennis]
MRLCAKKLLKKFDKTGVADDELLMIRIWKPFQLSRSIVYNTPQTKLQSSEWHHLNSHDETTRIQAIIAITTKQNVVPVQQLRLNIY